MAAGLLLTEPGAGWASVGACKCCGPLWLSDDDDDEASAPPWDLRSAEIDDDGAALAALAATTVFDSHCHTHAVEAATASERHYLGVVQAVEEADWDRVVSRCGASPRLRPGLGVHPWQAHLVEDVDGYLGRLDAALAAHGAAIVGEVGLCKCARNARGPKEAREAGLSMQRRLFLGQLLVATRRSRPASVHAVKQHAPLKDALAAAAAADGRPSVALHSFSGTAHHVGELLAVVGDAFPLYFGFSHTINVVMNGSRAAAALHAAIAAVPDDRVLVESDVDDPAAAREATCRAVALVAKAKGWTLRETAARTATNARAWLLQA